MSIEEKIDQAKGAAKEGVGKLTGDKKIEKEGAAEKAASATRRRCSKASNQPSGIFRFLYLFP